MKGINEKYLFEILNENYPDQWVSEYRAIEGRKFRCDAANPSKKICIEIEGGIFLGNKGGHTSGIGYTNNMEKYNLLTLDGWKVLRYSPKTLKSNPGIIISHIRQLCEYDDKGQQKLDFTGYKQAKIETAQVKIT